MKTPRIRKLRRRGDVSGLIEALGYTSLVSLGNGKRADSGVSVRLRALEALADLAGPGDVPAIGVALRDREPVVRQMAVRVTRKLDSASGADTLAATVVGPGQPEFTEARLEALDALEDLAKCGEAGTAKRIARAIVEGGPEVALDQVTQDALTGFVADASADEVSKLVEDLIDRLPAMNGSLEHAQVVLSWLGPHSVRPLIAALSREGGFREPAAAVLGAIRNSEALEPLTEILEDQRADVRRVAAWALGELRDPRTAEALMRATMDDEYEVRRQAGDALDEMGSIALMAGVANMIRSLEGRSDGPTVARLVEEGLERTPPSGRPRSDAQPGWAPRFVERFQLRRRAS
jgi:HEAT repeat protein